MLIQNKRESSFFDVCSPCEGNCCRNARPPLTLKRKQIIEAYLKEQKIPIDNPFVQTSYVFPKDGTEGYCIFYDKKTRKCLIHPVKPETCVAGPITFDINIKNRKIEWHLKMEKICPLAAVLYKNKGILKKHLASAKREILELVRELDPEALKAILKIEEPETFKIDEDNIVKDTLDKLTNGS
jgi:Fe-S-cluster containining protein